MPPKRRSLIDNPPDASSSSDEEEDVESEEVEEDEEEDGEENDEEEDEHEKASAKRSSAKNPVFKSVPTQNTVSGRQAHHSTDDEEDDAEESDSDEESGSDSEPSPEKPHPRSRGVDPNIKPITSKPMDDTPKPKKPLALASPTKATTTAKRPLEADKEGNRDLKGKRKKVSDADENGSLQAEDTEKKSGDDAKKQLFQRLWSEDDELMILRGMVDYHSKKGADPWTDMVGFHEFIKKALHVDVNKNQLADKIRRLKKKYKTNVGRRKGGKDPLFSKSHESKAFELSKKIWGSEDNSGGNNQATDDGKTGKKQKAGNAVKVPSSGEASNAAVKADEELNWSMYPSVMESFRLGEIAELPRPDFGEGIVKEGLGLMGNSKVKELEERWRKLHMSEIEMYLKRVDLFRDQLKMLYDALGSKMSGNQ